MNKQRTNYKESEFTKAIRIKIEWLAFLRKIKIPGRKTMAGKLEYILQNYVDVSMSKMPRK